MLKTWIPAFAGMTILLGNALSSVCAQTSTTTLTADKIVVDGSGKSGHAEGNVKLVDSSSTLTGSDATYNWETSTGVMHNATGIGPMGRFTAEELDQISPDEYLLKNGAFTTCDLDEPHYRFKSKRGKVRINKRIKLYNAEFVPDETPSFWTPYYTKSLVPKKYRLRIQPGHTGRDGYITRTIFGYPFTPHTWTNIRWDWLQYTGNGGGVEHIYDTPKIHGRFDGYYVRDSNPDPDIPQSKRYTFLWDHFQRITSRLTLNSKVDLQSDQSFGNNFDGVGNQVLVQNATRGLLSEAGLSYQFPLATMQLQVDRKDQFNTAVSSHQFINHLTLPRLLFNTAPLKSKKIPFYTSFNGSFTNDTDNRTDPNQSLHYKKNITAGFESKREIKLPKRLTLTPLVSYSQSWDNRILGSTGVVTEQDQYVGRYTLGMDGRRKMTRWLDALSGYRYGARNRPNQTLQDITADDHGVETNQLTYSLQSRIGRSTLLTLGSGFDFRDAPRSQPAKYHHLSERVMPPTMDIQYEIKKNVNLYYRETYSLFDSATQSPVATPVNTSGEIQFGDPIGKTFFSQGFAFTKQPPTDPSQLNLSNKIRLFATSKWYVDAYLSYRAVGPSGMDYRKLSFIEKSLRVVRDLHCWILRAEFAKRPGVTEASFYIDLKANASLTKDVFRDNRGSVTSTRNDGPDLGQLFPEPTVAVSSGPATGPYH